MMKFIAIILLILFATDMAEKQYAFISESHVKSAELHSTQSSRLWSANPPIQSCSNINYRICVSRNVEKTLVLNDRVFYFRAILVLPVMVFLFATLAGIYASAPKSITSKVIDDRSKCIRFYGSTGRRINRDARITNGIHHIPI